MTEDEARQRWCPFVRMPINRAISAEMTSTITCLASNCMAWRWTSPPHWRVKRAEGITVAVDKNTPDAYQTRGNGYCGIAGKPETP